METIMKYYYIGKDNSGRHKLPEVEFEAIRYKDDNGEYRLSPIDKNSWQYDGKKHFIRGKGYVKIGKKNKVTIPVFDNIAEHWNEYLSKYGAECLFYSISGKELNSPDCCDISEITEFKSICLGGAVGYNDFVDKFVRLVEIQKEIVKTNLFRVDGYYTEHFSNDLFFRPCYYMFYTFIQVEYSINPMKDDERMEKYYRKVREYELIHCDVRYSEYERVNNELTEKEKTFKSDEFMKSMPYREWFDIMDDLDKAKKDNYKVLKTIQDDARDVVTNELTTENDVFPTSVKDRVYYLFGKEAGDLYAELVDTYLKTNNTESDNIEE